MKPIFITHGSHEVHNKFASSIISEFCVTPFKRYLELAKKFRILIHLYLILAFFYSLKVNGKNRVILVDGGSSLVIGFFVKLRIRNCSLILLDNDLFFSEMTLLKRIFSNKIECLISVSEMNKNKALMHIDVPAYVAPPYPKEVKNLNVERKNFGLYVGRLDEDKKVRRIIEFAQQTKSVDKIFLIGEGIDKEYIKYKTSVSEKVQYLGYQKNLSEYYSVCKYFFHLADEDPHPCTTMEAAICGCFPLISRHLGTAYLFDERFLIRDTRDFNEIERKIQFIKSNIEDSKMALKKSVEKRLSKEESINNFRENFEELSKKLAEKNNFSGKRKRINLS